jgi:Flp pilus assembly protein TadD
MVDQAIALLQEALAHDSRHAEAHALLGVAYTQKGMVNEGVQSLRTAVSFDPNNVSARLNLAAALQRAGRLHDAISELSEVLRIDLNNPKAQEMMNAIQAQLQGRAAPTPARPAPPAPAAPRPPLVSSKGQVTVARVRWYPRQPQFQLRLVVRKGR